MPSEKNEAYALTYKNKHYTYRHHKTLNDKATNYYRHVHSHYELLFFISGHADFLIEDKLFPLFPLVATIIKPQDYHMLSLKSPTPAYERVTISFIPGLFDEKLLNCIFSESRTTSIESAYFFSWVKRIEEVLNTYDEDDKTIAVQNLFFELLLKLKYEIKAQKGIEFQPIENPTLKNAIIYINSNIDTLSSVKSLAQELFVSESYLYLLFKEYLDISPKQYILEKKLIRAVEYIRNNMNPTAISVKLGFSDYSSFYRAFKKKYQCQPSDFLKQS